MKIQLALAGILFSLVSLRADDPRSAAADTPMQHPGILHAQAELDFVQSKIRGGEEPWKTAWEQLKSSKAASLKYSPRPCANVVRGTRNNPNIGSSDLSRDSIAAYAHALQWVLTDDRRHAQKSIEILNAWSTTLESVSGHDARLLIGMTGIGLCNAAELMRHTCELWQPADQARFEVMLRDIFYDGIKDFYPTANGNWDASMIQTMLAMGVFLNDRQMFNRGIEYAQHGEGNGAIDKYFNEFGECQESGRDQGHTQMGLGFLGCACEIAWKQGIDLYSTANNRLALGYEYTAKYNLGEDVPYQPYRSAEGRYHYKNISSKSRGRFAPIYERVVHHYHERMGMEMPYSLRVANENRPEGYSSTYTPWGSLMSYGLPVSPQSSLKSSQ